MKNEHDESHLNEKIHADQHLKEIVNDECVLHQERLAILHETWPGNIDKIEVKGNDGDSRHGRSYEWPVICSWIFCLLILTRRRRNNLHNLFYGSFLIVIDLVLKKTSDTVCGRMFVNFISINFKTCNQINSKPKFSQYFDQRL